MIPVRFFTGYGNVGNALLNGTAWAALVGIPIAIVLLYFLKLRRQPLEVPSTYLWRRAIEDLHVNSLWQRLRKNWLLYLQLLLIALIILACLQPGWQGAELEGDRFIFLIDTSASMSAEDVSPSRLEFAKKRAMEDLDRMEINSQAMIISFSDIARVEQSFTDSKSMLANKVRRIRQTNRPTDMREALRAAAALANPGRTSEDATDVQVAKAKPATLLIYTDGQLPPVNDFSVGNLEPKFIPIGVVPPEDSEEIGVNNIGIVAFSTERNPEMLDQLQAFARIENFSSDDVTVDVDLQLNGKSRDAKRVEIKGLDYAGVHFELSAVDLLNLNRAELKLVLEHEDDLPLDNVAYAAVNTPRQARVLLVTSRNDALHLALTTGEAGKIAKVDLADVGVLADLPENKPHYDDAASGAYDLIIYDRCSPKEMPAANTLFIGAIPPKPVLEDSGESPQDSGASEGLQQRPSDDGNTETAVPSTSTGPEPRVHWAASPKQGPPLIIDIDRVHPLMQLIDMSNVSIVEGFALTPPQGGLNLMDADIGTLLAIAPRSGFEDAVMGFDLISQNASGAYEVNTNWPVRRSFPVFIMNLLRYLGGSRGALANLSVKPGQPIGLRTSAPVPEIVVRSPEGEDTDVAREARNIYHYNRTEQVGVYSVFEGASASEKNLSQQFTVNLFDSRESNLMLGREIDINNEPIAGEATSTPIRKELWKWLLILGLVVLTAEWTLYLFRMYR